MNIKRLFFHKHYCFYIILCGFLFYSFPLLANTNKTYKVIVGSERIHLPEYITLLKGKRVGILTNQTAIDHSFRSTVDIFKQLAKTEGFTLNALFAPEHGINGSIHADLPVDDSKDKDGIPIFSLHGSTKRPTPEMLKNIDVLVYDIQDIGSRSYTYTNTLLMAMEEAAKQNIKVIVLDRPNPLNGNTIDGPMLEEKWRSLVGYANVPYCHGMTVGELALWFNDVYHIDCELKVIPMKGWKRSMTFVDTGLTWLPTSPNIPEPTTPWYYPTTGILGALEMVNIGIGYTMPFKLVGAAWIDAPLFARALNNQQLPGVYFVPIYYKPFYGKAAKEECQGVNIIITNTATYKPVTTQYTILATLKRIYPKKFKELFLETKRCKDIFCKVNGTEMVYKILDEESNPLDKLLALTLNTKERVQFEKERKKYLLPEYGP